METCGINLSRLTIDDIVNAMRVNGIKIIEIDPDSGRDISKPYAAVITEWFGSTTVFAWSNPFPLVDEIESV